jgi:hypothetical protein
MFVNYASKHAVEWYQYANSVKEGWRIGSDELCLVTGTDKTDSWALAAYSNTARSAGIEIKLNVKFVEGRASYSYECEDYQTIQPRVSSDPAALKNQCVFARAFRISIKQDLLRALPMQVAVSPGDYKARTECKGSRSRSGGFLSRLLGRVSSVGGTGAQNGETTNQMTTLGCDSTTVSIEPLTETSPVNDLST